MVSRKCNILYKYIIEDRAAIYTQLLYTYLAIALPVQKEAVLVNFEEAVGFELGVLLRLDPAIEGRAVEQQRGHLALPVELELFRHPRRRLPFSEALIRGLEELA